MIIVSVTIADLYCMIMNVFEEILRKREMSKTTTSAWSSSTPYPVSAWESTLGDSWSESVFSSGTSTVVDETTASITSGFTTMSVEVTTSLLITVVTSHIPELYVSESPTEVLESSTHATTAVFTTVIPEVVDVIQSQPKGLIVWGSVTVEQVLLYLLVGMILLKMGFQYGRGELCL